MARRAAALLAALTVAAGLCLPAAARTPERTVRVGWFLVDGLHDIDESGRPSGYDYEYLRAIAQYTGWKYTFRVGGWNECLEWLKNGEIDLLGCVSRTAEREEFLDFPALESGVSGSRLICRGEDDRFAYGDYAQLDGVRIGSVRGSARNAQLQALLDAGGADARILSYESQEEILPALDAGEVDAVVISQTRRIAGYRVILQYDPTRFYFATTKGNTDIVAGLDRAINFIKASRPNFDSELYNKYFNAGSGLKAVYTKEEQAWLAEHPELTVAYDPAWRPIEYRDPDTGAFSGVMARVFERLSEATGITFRFVAGDSFSQTAQAYAGRAELFTALNYDFDWGDGLGYYLTQPLFEMQVYQLSGDGGGNRVAAAKDYYLTELMRQTLGEAYTFTEYDTVRDCVEAVRTGTADVTFLSNYEMTYYLSTPRYGGLNCQIVRSQYQRISVGVSKAEDARLFTIMTKAINSISDEEIAQILTDHTAAEPVSSLGDLLYANPLQALVLCLGGAALLFAVIYTLNLSRVTHRKNRELARANVALEQADAAKSEFLSRMSHEIRTPMNAVIGLSSLGLESRNDAEIQKYFREINEAGGYLLGLINDILDMSRIEAGRVELHPEVVNGPDFLRSIEEMMRPLADRRHVRLAADFSRGQTPWILMDRMRSKQIYVNLLNNAIKFSNEGGTVEWTVRDTVEDESHMRMVCTIRDHGCGMSEAFQRRLFLPFEQEHNQFSNQQAGTGLGLAIVKNLIEQMDGSIHVDSRLGEGTTVTFCLPRVLAAPEKAQSAPAPASSAALEGRRVLLCEDHPTNVVVARRLLEKKGLVVTVARNGREAVETFAAAPPGTFSAVLMDIRMPEIDGLEATRAIRALEHPDARRAPILAMTANAFAEDVEKSRAAGMNAHLSKPIQPERLYQALEQWIGRDASQFP